MSSPHYEVLALGDPYVDRILRVSDEYLHSVPGEKGGTLEITYPTLVNLLSTAQGEPEIIPGGSAANVMRGLGQLGRSCAMVGKIGNDDLAEHFLKSFAGLPITPLLEVTDSPTGQVICLVTPDGDRTQRTLVGSAGMMRPKDLKPAYFEGIRLLHVEGYSLRNGDLPKKAMQMAKDTGAKISMDLAAFELVGRHRALIEELIADYVDILFCNTLESEALTNLSEEETVSQVAEYCEVSVVTMGASGCWVQSGNEKHYCPTEPIQPTDSTGAGDLFSAGFLHAWLEGAPIMDCARIGSIMGKHVIQQLGPIIPKKLWPQLRKQTQEILSPHCVS